MRFHPRLPNDTVTLLLLAGFLIVISESRPRPATRRRTT